jgi:hypothetical protein
MQGHDSENLKISEMHRHSAHRPKPHPAQTSINKSVSTIPTPTKALISDDTLIPTRKGSAHRSGKLRIEPVCPNTRAILHQIKSSDLSPITQHSQNVLPTANPNFASAERIISAPQKPISTPQRTVASATEKNLPQHAYKLKSSFEALNRVLSAQMSGKLIAKNFADCNSLMKRLPENITNQLNKNRSN